MHLLYLFFQKLKEQRTLQTFHPHTWDASETKKTDEVRQVEDTGI